ncbi:hypothetical protein FOZ62_002619, partial [Perkinsus olseni]
IFYSEAGLEEKEAPTLSAKAIAVLSTEGNPAVETMRLQANFGDLFRCIESAAVNRDTARSAAVAGGIRRVVERSEDLDGRMDFEGYNQVYQLVNDLLFTTARIDSLTMKIDEDVEQEVRREVSPALFSVMPRTAVQSFCSLGINEKVCHLRELVSLVHGIRLYHSTSGDWKGAALDVNKVLGDSDNCRKADDVEARLGEINGKIAQLGEHIARLLIASFVSKKEGSGDCEHPEHLSQFAEDICYLRQCTVYLQSIQEDIERALGRLYNSRTQFAECMKLIDVGIGARTVVSKEEVYPRFDSLSKYYNSCRDELHFIDDRIQLAQMVLDQLSGY